MSAHVPGPWSVDEGKYGNLRVLADISPHLSWMVAVLEPQQFEYDKPGTQAATARLIAAAPDLLAALASITDECHEQRKTYAVSAKAINAARAAIAKARGK